MKVVNKRSLIRSVAERWRMTYSRNGVLEISKEDIYAKLKALNLETCSEEDVSNAIGNDSWTHLKCDECQTRVDWVLVVGEQPNYESATACLCRECCSKVYDFTTIYS